MAGEYDQKTLKKLQAVEFEVFQKFQQICRKYDLPYFAAGGTAIGAVRHKGFIPWDDDIDVCMLRKDYERFLDVAPQELGDGFDLLTIENTDGYVLTLAKLTKKGTVFIEETDQNRTYESGIFLDIFPYDVTASDSSKRAKQVKKAWFWARMCVMNKYGEVKLPDTLTGVKRSAAAAVARLVHGAMKLFHISKLSLYRKFLKATCLYEDTEDVFYADFSCMEPEKSIVRREDIFPLVEMPFENGSISMLHNYCLLYTSRCV